MTNAETAIRNYLLQLPSVTALVGNRIYSVPPKSPTVPCLTFYIDGGEYSHQSTERILSLEIRCYGVDPDDATNLDDALTTDLRDEATLRTLNNGGIEYLTNTIAGQLAYDKEYHRHFKLSLWELMLTD